MSFDPARAPAAVRLSELSDVVDAVPYLLGFTPTDSLVAVSMHGPRERLQFTMRIDLPKPAEDVADHAAMVAERMAAAEADSILVFIYTDPPAPDGPLPQQRLVDRILDTAPMPVRDALLVTPTRIWSYVCDDPSCCPAAGRPRPQETAGRLALAAAHALSGRAVLPDRDAVVASVQPVTGAARDAMEQAFARAAAGGGGAPVLVRVLRDRYADGPAQMTDDEAAQLALVLHDTAVRDEVIGWCLRHETPMRSLLGDLVSRALPPLDAPACTVLAWSAYLQGDGLVAATALERALTSDPAYSMAHLLQTALDNQVPPRVLRTLDVPAQRRRGRRSRHR